MSADPCKCGHPKRVHRIRVGGATPCNDNFTCPCPGYQPDEVVPADEPHKHKWMWLEVSGESFLQCACGETGYPDEVDEAEWPDAARVPVGVEGAPCTCPIHRGPFAVPVGDQPDLITDVIARTLKRHYRKDTFRCACGYVFNPVRSSVGVRPNGASLLRRHVAEQVAVLVESARIAAKDGTLGKAEAAHATLTLVARAVRLNGKDELADWIEDFPLPIEYRVARDTEGGNNDD